MLGVCSWTLSNDNNCISFYRDLWCLRTFSSGVKLLRALSYIVTSGWDRWVGELSVWMTFTCVRDMLLAFSHFLIYYLFIFHLGHGLAAAVGLPLHSGQLNILLCKTVVVRSASQTFWGRVIQYLSLTSLRTHLQDSHFRYLTVIWLVIILFQSDHVLHVAANWEDFINTCYKLHFYWVKFRSKVFLTFAICDCFFFFNGIFFFF